MCQLTSSYLCKGIRELERIKGAGLLLDLLTLIALQVGSLVSLSELALTLGVAVKTVERHLDLFEKVWCRSLHSASVEPG
ncbi:MAG: hypothetical protein FWF36_06455 [Propionibacteriaceae bacterium]|nr:hypothetical protein [Propionibacteriaceae bacterium]